MFNEMFPRARDIKERINMWVFIKLKSYCMAKENISKMKREPTIQESIFVNDTSGKGWFPKYIKNSHDSTPGRQNNPIKKWSQNLNRSFSKQVIQRAHRHIKRCSASVAIRKMQIKTTLRYHFTEIPQSEWLS